tara:strand:+ start:405 stop:899 length:495 start_codon:yes stop_codon:yes gene_type:complete
MKKTLINSSTKEYVNTILLEDDWTGKPRVGNPGHEDFFQGEWQVPVGQELIDDTTGNIGDIWEGTDWDRAVPHRDIDTVKEDKFIAANAEYVRRGLEATGIKVRGSDPEKALSDYAIKISHRGGPHANVLADLHDKLDTLKDSIEVATDLEALDAIDVIEGVHW